MEGDPQAALQFTMELPEPDGDLVAMLALQLVAAGQEELATQLPTPAGHSKGFACTLCMSSGNVPPAGTCLVALRHLSCGRADSACRSLLLPALLSPKCDCSALLVHQLLPMLGLHPYSVLRASDPRRAMLQQQLALASAEPGRCASGCRTLAQALAAGRLLADGAQVQAQQPDQPAQGQPYGVTCGIPFADVAALFGVSADVLLQPPGGDAVSRYRPWPEAIAAMVQLAGPSAQGMRWSLRSPPMPQQPWPVQA